MTEVYTIEIVDVLGQRAKKLLDEIGYENIEVKICDGCLGWPEQAPYDVILITAAAPHVPEPLEEQLAEGGRLVAPIGPRWTQRLDARRKACAAVDRLGRASASQQTRPGHSALRWVCQRQTLTRDRRSRSPERTKQAPSHSHHPRATHSWTTARRARRPGPDDPYPSRSAVA